MALRTLDSARWLCWTHLSPAVSCLISYMLFPNYCEISLFVSSHLEDKVQRPAHTAWWPPPCRPLFPHLSELSYTTHSLHLYTSSLVPNRRARNWLAPGHHFPLHSIAAHLVRAFARLASRLPLVFSLLTRLFRRHRRRRSNQWCFTVLEQHWILPLLAAPICCCLRHSHL